MGGIDVSKVVTTTQEYNDKTGEMVTKVTHVGPAVKDKKVGDVVAHVKVERPEEPFKQTDKAELEDRIKKLEQTIEELKKNQQEKPAEDQ